MYVQASRLCNQVYVIDLDVKLCLTQIYYACRRPCPLTGVARGIGKDGAQSSVVRKHY